MVSRPNKDWEKFQWLEPMDSLCSQPECSFLRGIHVIFWVFQRGTGVCPGSLCRRLHVGLSQELQWLGLCDHKFFERVKNPHVFNSLISWNICKYNLIVYMLATHHDLSNTGRKILPADYFGMMKHSKSVMACRSHKKFLQVGFSLGNAGKTDRPQIPPVLAWQLGSHFTQWPR